MFSINRSDNPGEVPGLRSLARAIFTPWRRKASIGGSWVSRKIESARQQHRDRARLGHGDGVFFSHEFQVVGRQRLVTRSQAGAVSEDNCSACSLTGTPTPAP